MLTLLNCWSKCLFRIQLVGVHDGTLFTERGRHGVFYLFYRSCHFARRLNFTCQKLVYDFLDFLSVG